MMQCHARQARVKPQAEKSNRRPAGLVAAVAVARVDRAMTEASRSKGEMRVKLEGNKEHRHVALEALRARVGEEIGVSDWLTIGQDRIDAFADLCGDHQFIHVDPERAAETPFGGTIAHGFLTLSLLTWFAAGVRPRIEGTRHSVNYGLDRLRFVAPVPAGSRVRGRFRLTSLEERAPGEVTQHYEVTVEIEAKDRPALVADWITRSYLEAG
jgi:acyl dehydratase